MIIMAVAVMALAGFDTPVDLELDSDNAESYEPGWYFGIGATNYYPRLRESEAKIDRQINKVFGVLPGWKEPTTFADWRGKHFLWDGTLGVGRDLSPKLTLMCWVGGSKGVIKNREQYGPLRTNIQFTRTSLFISPELFWYPLGKVDYGSVEDKRGGDWVRAAVAGAKPYLAVASGYTWVRAKGEGYFALPLVGTVLRQVDKEDHHMFMCSPRVGIDLPAGRNSSISAVAMYLFFSEHGREYNGPALSFNYRWRF